MLRERDVTVHLFGELLRTTVELPDAKAHILDAIFDDRIYGPLAIDALRNCFDAMDLDTLTDHLVGGITKREVLDRIPEPRSVAFHVLAPDDFVLEPLPNHLYTRDTSAWLYGGVVDQQHAQEGPRMRETAHYEAIYRWHPLFAGADVRDLVGGRRRTGSPPPRAATCWCSAAARC